jgi:hypothetical protein
MATVPLWSVLTLVAFFGLASASLTQSRLQNRHLQRVINHNRITIVLEGVRARALNTVKPDPILLINFPEINHQFKVNIKNLFNPVTKTGFSGFSKLIMALIMWSLVLVSKLVTTI